jgi:DNA gyrase subunit A
MLVSDLRVMGRATQGVRLINIKGTDSIAAVTKVLREEESDELLEDFEGDVENNFDDEIAEETEE